MDNLILLRFYRLFMLLWMLAGVPSIARGDNIEDFFKAVAMDNPNEISLFLQQGMKPNVAERYRGDTGLIVALREGSMRAFDVLVNSPNIDLEATANNGNNALMMAAYKGNQTAVDILLKKGVAINRPNWTALHYAAAGGKNDIVQILLDKGADINARSPNLTTPLMIAAYEGFDLTVKLLLDRGADVTLTNEEGKNAADYAKRLDRQNIVDLVNDYLKKAQKQSICSMNIDSLC